MIDSRHELIHEVLEARQARNQKLNTGRGAFFNRGRGPKVFRLLQNFCKVFLSTNR